MRRPFAITGPAPLLAGVARQRSRPCIRLCAPLLTVGTSAATVLGTAATAAAQSRAIGVLGERIDRIGEQVNVGVDAGAAAVTYDGYDRGGVVSVTPSVRWENARAMFLADASFSEFASGNTSLQTAVSGSVISPEVWKLRGEVYGNFSSTHYERSLAATNIYGVGRLHAAGTYGGAWVGAGGGFVSQGTQLPNTVLQLDAGLWARDEGALYTLTVLPTRVGELHYADITGAARWEGPRSEVAVTVGYRARPNDEVPGVQAWGEAWLTVWLGHRVALVTGAGLFPFDAVQALPGGRYASAGLRVVTRRAPTGDPMLRAELTESYELSRLRQAARGRASVEACRLDENPDGTRTLRVRVPGAHRVELMADFTDWAAVPLAPVGASGDWGATLAIGPGVHRINVRVDDGAWEVPPGLSAVRDEFGGAVGLLVVR